MRWPGIKQTTVALVAGLLLVSVGSVTAVAHGGAGPATSSGDDVTELGSFDINVEDATIHIQDTHVTGPGLPDESIDEGTYSIETETTIGGLTFTLNGQTYEVCRIHVTVDDVGVTLENVSIGDDTT